MKVIWECKKCGKENAVELEYTTEYNDYYLDCTHCNKAIGWIRVRMW